MNKFWSKGKIAYLVGMLLFVVYLISADSIFLSMNQDYSDMRSVSFYSIESNQEPRCAIDSYEYLGGGSEEFFVSGWAFCETDYDNSDKHISLVFKSTTGISAFSYTFPEIYARDDVYDYFHSVCKIKNNKVNFKGTFSTLAMTNGTYELYVHVEENSSDYGIVSTNMFFRKSAAGIEQVGSDGSKLSDADKIITRVDIQPEDIEPTGRGYIDSAGLSEGFISATGWAYFSAEYNRTQKIFVSITDEGGNTVYYSTIPQIRNDLAASMGDASYAACGFNANIPYTGSEGIIKLGIIIKAGDKYYPISTGGSSIVAAEEQSGNYNPAESLAELSPEAPGVGKPNYNLEQLEACGNSLSVGGWVYLEGRDSAEQKVYICIGDSYYQTNQVCRPDVAKCFKNELYNMSGFKAELPLDEIPEGESSFRIMVEQGGVLYECVTNTITRSGNIVSQTAA